MIKVVFFAYRDWALEAVETVKTHANIETLGIVDSKEAYDARAAAFAEEADLFVFIGWSWLISKSITNQVLCVGMHPSDLPAYRGGSPIQNQIIDGITETKISLFSIGDQLDAGAVWCKESVCFLGDDMQEILRHITDSTIRLLTNFFNQYPAIQPEEQAGQAASLYKRRKPEDSKMSREWLANGSLEEIYNFIRCLTDPYPNAFIEDANGNRLFFQKVSFKRNER